MSKRLRVLAVIAVAVVVIGWSGVVVAQMAADRSRDRSVSTQAATAAEQEAHLFWDNPFQRMLYVAESLTKARPELTCPLNEVTAYTFFGVAIDRVSVDCAGIHR